MLKTKKKINSKKNKKISDLFLSFPAERKSGLQLIERFGIFDTMYYRTNDWIHCHRVAWITEELMKVAKKYYKNCDAEKAILLALVHDDAEVITGDYNASHKVFGSKKFKAKILQEEASAIEKLVKKYPKYVGKYNYRDLLLQAMWWDGIEGKIVSYADQLDALYESLHEVFAGNLSFLTSVVFCSDRIARFEKKYPELVPLLNHDSIFTNLKVIYRPDFSSNAHIRPFNKPFNAKSIKTKTIFPGYDKWRELTIKNWGKDGLDALIKQKESFK